MKINECDCVILCGGLGKRLRSVVDDVPKVMAAVDGRPFLDIIIEYLKSQGISRVILCTGYKADLIEEHYRAHDFGLTIDFSTETQPLGTGGAVKNAQDIIASDPFFVLNGDSFIAADLKSFFKFHEQTQAAASILVSKVGEGRDFGTIGLDANNKITEFKEKTDQSGESLVNAGMYCFSKAVFSQMPKAAAFSLEKDLFPALAGDQLYGFPSEGTFFDIGTPKRYSEAQEKLKKEQ